MPNANIPNVFESFLFPEIQYGIVGSPEIETSKLQQAINDASTEGKILILPPFDIKVSTITIPEAGVRIWGQSGLNNSERPKSRIVSDGSNAPIISIPNGVTHFEIDNVSIVGTGAGSLQNGIQSTTTSSLFRISNLRVSNCGGSGLKFSGQTFSYELGPNIYSSGNIEHNFDIDAVNAPCVRLISCYAGVVANGKYGYYIRRGDVQFDNCNSLDGSGAGSTCVRLGDSGVGTAIGTFHGCNFESFTSMGVYADIGSDARFYNCRFIAPGSGVVQPLKMDQPTGLSFIDDATTFVTGGATYNNAGASPIVIFSRFINAPYNINPLSALRQNTFWNSEDGRLEPLANLSSRLASQTITSATYTESRSNVNYYGVNRAGAVTVNLVDPQSNEALEGRIITIKDESGAAGANNITVQTVNTRNIDGAASVVISSNYGRVTLVKRGNNYWRID